MSIPLQSCAGCWRCLSAGTMPGRSARPASTAEKMPNSRSRVKMAFQANRRVYGSPRVHAELQAQGITCARKRVARLMREQGLFAQRPRHRTITTKSEQGAQVSPNLLQRDFSADEPNTKWVADTTYYNRTRRHSTLHYRSPLAYEQLMC